MPTKRHSNRAKTKRQDILRAQKDAAAKARALKKYGLAEFRGSLAAKNMTPARIKRAEKLFSEAQRHAVYTRGHTERMFYRPEPRKGYQLNTDYFRFLKSKSPVSAQQNVVKTAKGNIVATTDKNARIVGVAKDGTIHIKQGAQDVFTGRMSDAQTLKFLRDVDSGKYKFPKDYRIGITYFQNSTGEVTVNNLRELQRELRYYSEKIRDTINDQYPNFEPLKLTFYKLSAREIELNERHERKLEADRARRKKAKNKSAKKKTRRYRSRN